MADPEQFLRQIQQNAQSLATKAENKEVRQYRADQRHQHRTVNSHQAKLELQLRRMAQNELNRAVDEALKNAQPAAAKDPNGPLGKPQPLNPEQTPMVVTPVQPIPVVPPQKGALPSAMTKNLGTADVEEGETKAGLLTQNQLVECRRLQAEAGSGITLEQDDHYIKVASKDLADPEGPVIVGDADTSPTGTPEVDDIGWNRTDADQDGVSFTTICRVAKGDLQSTFLSDTGETVNIYRVLGIYRNLLFDKRGCLVHIGEESVDLAGFVLSEVIPP